MRWRPAPTPADVSVVYNVISSAAVPEIIAEQGARGVRTRVGHSFIKAEMAREEAVFGGEHSAHYYFRDFWFADTGMLAAMHVLAALGEQDGAAEPASPRHTAGMPRRARSTRRSPTPRRPPPRSAQWAAAQGAEFDELDGLTVDPRRATTATRCGGSTCGRPTPSRCCGSTSRPPMQPRWRGCGTMSSPW